MTTTRTYGTNYNADLTVKEIAAKIRKTFRNADELEGWNVSVRYRTASMMQAIDVRLSAPAGMTLRVDETTEALNRQNGKAYPWLTDDARTVKAYAESVHSSYNHDGSDTQSDYFDVRYYGSVDLAAEGQWGWKN